MRVSFIKTSHEEYTLECVRGDGSTTRVTLEAKGYLKHDMVHLVYEREAELTTSFYGMVNAGRSLESLTPQAMKGAESVSSAEALTTEIVVGALQGSLTQGEVSPDMSRELAEYIRLQGMEAPAYLTQDVLERVHKEVKQLLDRYAHLKTGEGLEREF